MRWAVVTRLAVAVAVTVPAAQSSARVASPPNDLAAAAIREAIKLESRAAGNIPEHLAQASADLAAAASKLGPIKGLKGIPPGVELAVSRAAGIDTRLTEDFLDPTLNLATELEPIVQALRTALELKREALDLIAAAEFKETGMKSTPPTTIGVPQCRKAQSATSGAACFTLDFWDINVDHAARAARCEFRNAGGKLLTNTRPLLKGVLQETTCTLTGKTRVVDGVRKRIVHAELKLTAPSGAAAGGSASVVVTAFWQ